MREHYVYVWENAKTKEIVYVGFGKGNRYKSLRKRNNKFNEYVSNVECVPKVIVSNLDEQIAKYIESELILYYWEKGQAILNLHKGGSGGDTVSLMTPESLKRFREVCGKVSTNNWSNPIIRDKIITNCRNAMKTTEVRNKVSTRTKIAMHEPDCWSKFVKARATSITLISPNNERIEFETRTLANKYVKKNFGVSSKALRLKEDRYIHKNHRWAKLIGYTIIQKDKDGNRFVSTIRDECSGVE